MRKILSILLVAVCLLALGGCKGQVAQTPETDPSDTKTPALTAPSPYFTGKVLEKFDGSFLAEVTDVGDGNLAVGQQVVVHINTPDCPEFAVGDSLTISFDGKMTCSLPPQVVGVAIIRNNG